MGAKHWPNRYDYEVDFYDDSLDDLATKLRMYCRDIVQHTLKYPFEQPSAQQIRDLAAFCNQFAAKYLYQSEEEAKKDYNMASLRRIEDWVDEVDEVESIPGEPLPEKDQSPFPEENELVQPHYLVQVRWDTFDEIPYANATTEEIAADLDKILMDHPTESLRYLAYEAIFRPHSYCLNIEVHDREKREAMIRQKDDWLDLLREGEHAVVVQQDRAVILCFVPRLPSTIFADICDAMYQIDADTRIKLNLNISYIGWLRQQPPPGELGDILIVFKDPEEAAPFIKLKLLDFNRLW
ncbi:hypothetical protein Plec18170_000054 [Paecilomyces lecythidis]